MTPTHKKRSQLERSISELMSEICGVTSIPQSSGAMFAFCGTPRLPTHEAFCPYGAAERRSIRLILIYLLIYSLLKSAGKPAFAAGGNGVSRGPEGGSSLDESTVALHRLVLTLIVD